VIIDITLNEVGLCAR